MSFARWLPNPGLAAAGPQNPQLPELLKELVWVHGTLHGARIEVDACRELRHILVRHCYWLRHDDPLYALGARGRGQRPTMRAVSCRVHQMQLHVIAAPVDAM